MVLAALPESCWYTMLLARLSNVPLEGWGTNPVPPTRSMTPPRGRCRAESTPEAGVVHAAPGETLERTARGLGHEPGPAHALDDSAERAVPLGELAAGGGPVDPGDARLGEEAGDHVGHRRILTWRATWASRSLGEGIARCCRSGCSAAGGPGSSPGWRRG